MDDYPIIFGQVMTTLAPLNLKQALLEVGVAARVRHSSHYITGQYLAVEDDGTILKFERIEDDEYLVHGDADTTNELISIATLVSDVLSELCFKHRFEIYCPSSEQIAYLHYDWAQN